MREPGVAAWSAGELLGYAGWSSALVYVGAHLAETYGASPNVVGLVLGTRRRRLRTGSARRPPDLLSTTSRLLLAVLGVALAASILAWGVPHNGLAATGAAFAVLCFLGGARTYLGSARGLAVAPAHHVETMALRAAAAQFGVVLGAAVAGLALAAGGYPLLAVALASLSTPRALRLTRLRSPARDGVEPPLPVQPVHSEQLRPALAELDPRARDEVRARSRETSTALGSARAQRRTRRPERRGRRASRLEDVALARVQASRGSDEARAGGALRQVQRGAHRIARAGPSNVASARSAVSGSCRHPGRARPRCAASAPRTASVRIAVVWHQLGDQHRREHAVGCGLGRRDVGRERPRSCRGSRPARRRTAGGRRQVARRSARPECVRQGSAPSSTTR